EAPMRSAKWLLLAAMAAGSTAAAAADAPDRQAEANAAFTEYPKASLANNEQGTVHYRVKIDRKGVPRQCEVTQSSGFERLDMATCDLLMSRARFSRTQGRRSVYDGKVVWRIG
ncbi:MAG TPA: energy transducer TonB, partial [Allosphingosinicella sp.]|nr:energy transducer TonB [Allosphingosinicella sp.]